MLQPDPPLRFPEGGRDLIGWGARTALYHAMFGFAAFMAWYNALAGIADDRYVYICYYIVVVEEFVELETDILQQLVFRDPCRPFPVVG